jgi:hypothetical protein
MKIILCVLLLSFSFSLQAQPAWNMASSNKPQFSSYLTEVSLPKLYQRNSGAIVGLQRGRFTSIEFGGEAHWRKISIKKPHILGANASMEYNFINNIIGYKAGIWQKRGRVNLTYGANLVYFTDFKGKSRYGAGPAVGFRLAGFHFINGYNFLAGNRELTKVNTLYVSLRYYFPIENKFTWDKKEKRQKERTKKKKRKEREERKKDRPKLFDFLKKDV